MTNQHVGQLRLPIRLHRLIALYRVQVGQGTGPARDVWALPVAGADWKPFPVAQTSAAETNGRLFPDVKKAPVV